LLDCYKDVLTLAVNLRCLPGSLFRSCAFVRTSRLQGISNFANEAEVSVNDEHNVLAQISRGDTTAFAGLYDRHAALVYGIAKRILNDPVQAEDVTQSVFTMLWAKPSAFGGGNFAAWIARVARNAALDIVRSAAVRTREPEMPEDIATDSDLEDEVFSRIQSSAVVQALRALPDEQREAIEQAYLQGFSYSEVADRLGTPLGTVKSRIRTGLRRLWEALQRQAIT
jgi:RNA polymerase sigma-70 factor (ECF subfamily)